MEGLVRIAHLAPSAFLRFGSKFAKAEWVRNIAVSFSSKRWRENVGHAHSYSKSHCSD